MTKKANKVLLLSDKPVDYQLQLKNRALAATSEGITISDNLQPDNPIVYANEGFERLTGYTREDVLGKNCRFLQGEKTDPKTIEEIRLSIREEKPCIVEILNYRKDGTIFWNRLSITPLRDESGRVTNFLGIQSDITRRKKFENALFRVSAKLEQTNKRMKKDLEDARQLQLAMLPANLPRLPYLEIAVDMRTAQEVGGDYYDFYLDDDQLTFTIGDATGHGLKAGTIVTATKTLFNSFAMLDNPKEILSKISGSLKEMGFRNMYMAMLIAKISKKDMVISSAGMPYSYMFRKKDKTVVDIPLKGMPLGGFPGFVYQSKKIELNEGNTFLFLSDGLSECFNPEGESFGEARIESLFQKVAHQTPTKIIKHLTEAATDWKGSSQLRDDMTLVVMKIKGKKSKM
ncbi:SpoIIE family protein phosphatase [Calditrichota bacterium]